MSIVKVNRYEVAVANSLLKSSKILNKKIDDEDEVIKIANAKDKPDPNLPEQETQYILED